MNAEQRDELIERLDRLEQSTMNPVIPINRDTLREILAALRRCKAIEDGD